MSFKFSCVRLSSNSRILQGPQNMDKLKKVITINRKALNLKLDTVMIHLETILVAKYF